jgi:hypothetical protein
VLVSSNKLPQAIPQPIYHAGPERTRVVGSEIS